MRVTARRPLGRLATNKGTHGLGASGMRAFNAEHGDWGSERGAARETARTWRARPHRRQGRVWRVRR
jgi:hypothetical protein